MVDDQDGVRLTAEQRRRRKTRSIAIALVLVGLVVLFYAVTIVKWGAGHPQPADVIGAVT